MSSGSIHQVYGPTVHLPLRLGQARNPRKAGRTAGAARVLRRDESESRVQWEVPVAWLVSVARGGLVLLPIDESALVSDDDELDAVARSEL